MRYIMTLKSCTTSLFHSVSVRNIEVLVKRTNASACIWRHTTCARTISILHGSASRSDTSIMKQRHLIHMHQCSCRHLRTDSRKGQTNKMSGWQIHEYGGNDQLTLCHTCRVPPIKKLNDILIEVHAASVNPIDVGMRGGYGSSAINTLRGVLTWANKIQVGPGLPLSLGAPQTGSEFPLVLGRDFSGVVIKTGHGVTRFKPGDEVWGALGAEKQGTHAQFTLASEYEISLKPKSVSHIEAASLPYVATTTWSAVSTIGNMTPNTAKFKRVFVNGGSGGVGSFAIQLFKAWGADVVTTCATDAVDMVTKLGADVVIDYKTSGVESSLKQMGGFDFILDTVGGDIEQYQASILTKGGMFVTIVTPLLRNIDEQGMLRGLAKSAASLLPKLTSMVPSQKNYRWAFFIPDGKALGKMAELVDSGQIIPQIDKVFTLEDLPKAYDKVGQKHGRGKSVVKVKT